MHGGHTIRGAPGQLAAQTTDMAQPNLWSYDRPRTGILRSEPQAQPLSQRLWGLDWRSILPWHFDDASAEFATQDEVLPFIRTHYGAIFGAEEVADRFLPSPMTEAKRRFFAEMDFFVFRVGQETAGVFVANPTDWSSYYLRSTAVLPQHRQRRLMTHFFERLAEPLRAAGVERIEADVSPANAAIIRVLSRQGYIVTGSAGSERWGLLLRYTKFLSQEANATFIRQYTAMTFSPQRKDNQNNHKEQSHEEVRRPHPLV